MSRIGNAPVKLPQGVTLSQSDQTLTAKGTKGELSVVIPAAVKVEIDAEEVRLSPNGNDKQSRSLWGTTRANVANIVTGVSEGFTRRLEINGVGYRAAMQGAKLQLSLGYSHPVLMDVPEGLTVTLDGNTKIAITGADKQLLGQFAAEVRAKRPPEPFKGKGVKYAEEHIVRKEGKKK